MLRFQEIIGGFSRKEVGAVLGPNDWAQQHEADKSTYELAGFLKEKSASPAGLTPEHSARPWASDGYPEVVAAYRYVDSVVQHADAISPCGGHAWHGWALREAFLAGCTHHRENGGYIVPTVEEVTASPYAIELDETTAQVLTCPECSSTSVGFSPWPLGARTHSERRGNIEAEIFAFDFRCEDCGEQWELQVEACTGQRGQALSLTLEIIPKAPCILPTFITPSTPSRTLTGLFKRFFGESKAA